MSDHDWMLSNGLVEFRQEERNHAAGRYPSISRGQGRIPPECSCLEYGHGMSLTIVHSRDCPVHGEATA